jgi:type IX secretion system PorP/SprF family membrane protein
MKNLITMAVFLLISTLGVCQVYRNFGFYNLDPKLINPAYAGLLTSQDYQSQLLAKDMDPESRNYSLMTASSGKINSIQSGWGVILWAYRRYNYYEYNGSIQYNYQCTLSNTATLSIGTQWGFSSSQLDFSGLDVKDLDDPSYGLKDVHNKIIGDFGIALHINKFNAGIGTTNLIVTNNVEFSSYTPNRRYNVFAMYDFKITPWLNFIPSFMMTTNLQSSPYVELNGLVKIKNIIMLGTTRELEQDYSYQKYIAGIDIMNRFQFIATLYAGYNHCQVDYYTSDGLNLEVMSRWRIPLQN